MNREIRKHVKQAKKAGKCAQCQFPWHDGICSCGGWGSEEKRIAGIAHAKLSNERDDRHDRMEKELTGKLDKNLYPVSKLEGLWEK